MQKRDFETYQKRFRDFENPPKVFETHFFRGTIRQPLSGVKKAKTAWKPKTEGRRALENEDLENENRL